MGQKSGQRPKSQFNLCSLSDGQASSYTYVFKALCVFVIVPPFFSKFDHSERPLVSEESRLSARATIEGMYGPEILVIYNRQQLKKKQNIKLTNIHIINISGDSFGITNQLTNQLTV